MLPDGRAARNGANRVMARSIEPTGVERHFGRDEIIVSKTDPRGRITYANQVFLRIAGYEEREVLGQPHSLVRHPDMPRCVFKLLWDTIEGGREIFAYVKNMAKNGDHYWVFAHVTPTLDDSGTIIGYHSNRRCPERNAIAAVAPLYEALLDEEKRAGGGREGMAAATSLLLGELGKRGLGYDEFAFTL
jgi:PAS domain S-box-containing protein